MNFVLSDSVLFFWWFKLRFLIMVDLRSFIKGVININIKASLKRVRQFSDLNPVTEFQGLIIVLKLLLFSDSAMVCLTFGLLVPSSSYVL